MNKSIVVMIAVLLLVILGLIASKKWGFTNNPVNWDNWGTKTNTKVEQPPKKETKVEPLVLPKNYAEALTYAKAKNKKLLVLFKTGYCPACKRMDKDTLNDPSVLKSLKENNICLIYYVNPDVEPEVARQYKVTVVPCYWIIDANETRLNSGLGYKDASTFIAWASENRIRTN